MFAVSAAAKSSEQVAASHLLITADAEQNKKHFTNNVAADVLLNLL